MIFYFSANGNSRWAAKTIAETLNDVAIDMSEAIAGSMNFSIGQDENLGLCFPVYGWRVPPLVKTFINHMSLKGYSHQYTFALITAGDTIGETLEELQTLLKQSNLHLQAACSLIMPETYVGLPFMDVDKLSHEEYKKQKAKQTLLQFVEKIKLHEEDTNDVVKGKWPAINSRLLGGLFYKYLVTDKHFKVDTQKCIQCGKCAKVCPVGNIDCGSHSFPTWLHTGKCLTCFACYHHCSVKAIDFGRFTHRKGQYFYELNNH